MLPPEWGHLDGKGCGETGKGPAVRQGPWAYALQGDVQGAGVKHDEDDCKKQNGRSLHVFKEKVQRCLSRTSFSVNRQYKKKWQLQTVAGRVGLGQFRKKLSSLGEQCSAETSLPERLPYPCPRKFVKLRVRPSNTDLSGSELDGLGELSSQHTVFVSENPCAPVVDMKVIQRMITSSTGYEGNSTRFQCSL